MIKIENTLLVVLVMFIIIFSTFFISIGTSNSVNETNLTNQTNNTNSTNITKKLSPDLSPQSVGIAPSVSIQVTPQSLDLGSMINDGLEQSYTNSTQVTLSASQWLSAGTLNFYIRSSGNFNSGNDTIVLSNFKYNGFSSPSTTKKDFTTANVLVNSWDLQGLIYYSVSANVNGNYYLTIPIATNPGVYSTTVYYTATIV